MGLCQVERQQRRFRGGEGGDSELIGVYGEPEIRAGGVKRVVLWLWDGEPGVAGEVMEARPGRKWTGLRRKKARAISVSVTVKGRRLILGSGLLWVDWSVERARREQEAEPTMKAGTDQARPAKSGRATSRAGGRGRES